MCVRGYRRAQARGEVRFSPGLERYLRRLMDLGEKLTTSTDGRAASADGWPT
jgi:hypothetical protein